MLPRHPAGPIERSLRHFPVVMVLGARQTGKSTLVALPFPAFLGRDA